MAYITDKNGNYKRTVTCSHCYETGHNKSSCPKQKKDLANSIAEYEDQIAKDNFSDDWDRSYATRRLSEAKAQLDKAKNRGKNRKCSYCHGLAHTRRTCADRKSDIECEAHKIKAGREILAPRLEEYGIGVGALIEHEGDIYTVEKIDWSYVTQGSIIGINGHADNATRPITARSFPTEHYTRGRVSSFALPDEVTNIEAVEISRWAMCKWKLLSPAPKSCPSDFTDIHGCRIVSKGLEMFNDGNDRPYGYLYPNG